MKSLILIIPTTLTIGLWEHVCQLQVFTTVKATGPKKSPAHLPKEVLECVAWERSDKEISDELDISSIRSQSLEAYWP
ncbi:hypothetical protein WMW72_29225 [Paenibacillus filicis]|uniref:Secreted protein n=1 Tax=Paenibacillus filicis TaxID=669464 RepID=A0ABU9DW47_9BACL